MKVTQATLKKIIKEEIAKIIETQAGAGPADESEGELGHDEAEEEGTVDEGAFSPNHYCVHHGGVQHEGETKMAEAVSHNYDRKLGRVTHYNMKLKNGTILENVAAENIQITDASLAEGHGGHEVPGKRDHEEHDLDDLYAMVRDLKRQVDGMGK